MGGEEKQVGDRKHTRKHTHTQMIIIIFFMFHQRYVYCG